VPFGVFAALALLAAYGLGAAGCGSPRPVAPLVAGGRAAGAPPGSSAPAVLVESPGFALPPSAAGNRFDSGWERRDVGGRPALVPAGSGAPPPRLRLVNLGEEVQRTLTLDLARDGLPEGARLSVRAGEREVARATVRGAALPLRVRLPEDLPVGEVALDLVFAAAGAAAAAPPAAGPPGAAASPPAAGPGAVASPPAARPALYGATLSPVLPPGSSHLEGQDVVLAGNCLLYLHCQLAGNEALVGTFVPPPAARAGQRFELSVEGPDGTPIRRFHWQPSFWNRLRGARRFELPLRGTRGPVLVRLISRAGDAGGPPGRWRGLGLVNVTGEILTPGQGQ
jgi:hypothetical protein